MLRRLREMSDLVAAEREEDAARRSAKRENGLHGIGDFGPTIAGDRRPGRPAQREQRHSRLRGGHGRIGGDDRGIGMGGVDQRVDALGGEIGRKAVGAAEAADPHRHRLGGRRGRAARQRKRYLEIGTARETPGQLPRLAGAAEYENVPHAAR